MRILLFNAPWKDAFCRTQRWPVVNRTEALRYPDWLAYATAVLEQENRFEVKLVDYIANKRGHEGLYEDLRSFKPQVVVMELTTPSYFNDFEIGRKCKELGVETVIFTGPHATVFPEQTLRDAKGGVDILAIGEYDFTILDIVNAKENGNPLSDVFGIAYLENDNFVLTANRALIEDLDLLPFMSWHQLDVKQYHNHTYNYPYIDMIAGRGCPNKCSFCLWPQTMMGQRYRLRSAEKVYDEMVYHWTHLGIKEIFFEDDTLTANKNRLRKLCELIINGQVKMTWSCNCRCDLNDYELLCLMKKAGCRMLLIGPESGNQQILDNVHKNLTVEQIRDFCSKAKKAGLKLHSCWVFGLPGETKETIAQTHKFILALDTHTIQASSAMPQVGTELYNWAVENKYLTADSWEQYAADGEQIPVLQYPHLSQADLNEAVNYILKIFYYRPSKIFKLFIDAIFDWGLLASYIRGGVKFTAYLLFKKSKVDKKLKKV